jgi:biopolymer transport protein ExbD
VTKWLVTFLVVVGCAKRSAPPTAAPITNIAPVRAAPACPVTIVRVRTGSIVIQRATADGGEGMLESTRDRLREDLAAHAAICVGELAVVADAGVVYQDVITVMDIAIQASFVDVTYASSVDDARRRTASDAGARARSGSLPDAPVILVSTSSIVIAAITISLTSPDLKAQVRAALLAAPQLGPPGTAILKADASTDARVIYTIIGAAHDAGFDNLLFAVQ